MNKQSHNYTDSNNSAYRKVKIIFTFGQDF